MLRSVLGIRVRLLLLVLLAIIPAFGVIVYSGFEQRRLAARQAQEEALRLVRLVAQEQEAAISGARQLLQVLGSLPEVRRHDGSACSAFLADLLRGQPRYANFGANRRNGDMFCSALPLPGRVSSADRLWFRRAVETRAFAIGEYQVGRVTGRASIDFGYPVLDAAGEVQAVVFAALDLAWLARAVADVQLPPGSTFTLLDHKAVVLARYPNPEQWVGKTLPPQTPLFQAIQAGQGEGTTEARGADSRPRLYGFTRLRDQQGADAMYLAIGLPREIAFAQVNRVIAGTLAWLGLAAALALLAAWLGGDLLVLRRVTALVGAAKRVGAGDLGARTGLAHHRDEMGQLAASFDATAESLVEVGKLLTETVDLDVVFTRITERAAELLRAPACLVGLLERDQEGAVLRFPHARGIPPAYSQNLRMRAGEAVGGKVIQERRPVWTSDILNDPGLQLSQAMRQLIVEHGIPRAVLAAPMIRGETAIGVLAVHRPTGSTYTPTDVEVLAALAGQAAIAIQNAHLYEGSQRRGREAMALASTARQLAESLQQEQVLERIVQQAGALTGSDLSYIAVREGEGSGYRVGAVHGARTQGLQGLMVGAGRGLGGVALATGTAAWTDDYLSDPRVGTQYHGVIRDEGMLSQAVVPVRQGTEVAALLYVASRAARPYTEADLDLLGRLADHAAIALRNAALYAAAAQAREAAEQANRAKSEFLSRMSHELRTPLNAILGFAQLLQIDAVTPEQCESVEHILKGGRHLLDLINEVLDITRIETGRLHLSPEPVPVADLLRETLDLVRPVAAQRSIGLDLAALPAEDGHVQADRQRLKQVLLNLLANAIKYNRDNGTVTVTCQAATGDRLQIRVTDGGPGIPPALLERLFIPFDRLGAEQSGVEGSGLGLALSKALVEAMGGTIGVASTLGDGSTFWVELPLAEAPAAPPAPVAQGTPAAAGPTPRATILYIEDNLSNLTLIERVLAHRPGVKLLPAMQGRVGVDLAREHRPDIILLDLHLPDLAGHEVLQHLQGDPRTRDIPVIVISADATPGQIARLRAHGVRDYLTKPLDVQRLLAVLDNTLKGGAGRLDDTRTERGAEVGAE